MLALAEVETSLQHKGFLGLNTCILRFDTMLASIFFSLFLCLVPKQASNFDLITSDVANIILFGKEFQLLDLFKIVKNFREGTNYSDLIYHTPDPSQR